MTAALRASSVLCLARRALPAVYMTLGLVGMASVVFATFQYFGFSFWETYRSYPTGLFYSPITQGGFLGLVIVALARIGWWEAMIVPAFGLCLNPNRGGLVVAGVGLFATWDRHPLNVLLLILAGAFYFSVNPTLSDQERFVIWQAGIGNLSWFGHGWGSFADIWIIRDGLAYQPVHAHNDYLELAFEFGLYAIPAFCLILWALTNVESDDWPILVAFCTMSTFAMPLYIPSLASIGAIALLSTLAGVQQWPDGPYETRTT